MGRSGERKMKKEAKNMKHLTSSDPEFTAKALGEKEWKNSNAPVDPDFKEEFESLETFAVFVEKDLKYKSSKDTLDEFQLRSIEDRASSTFDPAKPSKTLFFPKLYWVCGIAAAIMLMLFIPFSTEIWMNEIQKSVQEDEGKEIEFMLPPPPLAPIQKTQLSTGDNDYATERLDLLVEEPWSLEAIRKDADTDLSLRPRMRASQTLSMVKKDAHAYNDYEIARNVGGRMSYDGNATTANRKPAAMLTKSEDGRTQQKAYYRAIREEKFRVETEEVYELSPFTMGGAAVPDLEDTGLLGSTPSKSEEYSREGYAFVVQNPFRSVLDHPLSTFSIDVDTASYANIRRFLNDGSLPPIGAVRIEEMINYFDYPSYTNPTDETPISVEIASTDAPWNPMNQLVRIGLKSGEIPVTERPDANLVFLVDVSGSMNQPNKLPLVKQSLKLLVEQMGEKDRIAVVVYAGSSGIALPSTTANNTETIVHAIDHLRGGGSTNGAAGIQLAYDTAEKHFIEEGVNRVILCSDGDFNVGLSSDDALVRLIQEKRDSGVFFSIMGFGSGNYQDAKMELLSNKGNGNFAYIDSITEARKQLVANLLGMLTCVAKDVKIQVEFNPSQVQSYRLIGYENRMLEKEDFNDDSKDAGEMGAGHAVTALYEVVPSGNKNPDTTNVDPLKYQTNVRESEKEDVTGISSEMLTVKVRYKLPDSETSTKTEEPYSREGQVSQESAVDLQFAAAVAAFGMKLREQPEVHELPWSMIENEVRESLKSYSDEDRVEFLQLLKKAAALK